jgi:nucleoside-diphosphate-sugar epimerase
MALPDPGPAAPADLTGARIAVTGATGFIGRHIVHGLAARGAEVWAVVRDVRKAESIAQPGLRVLRGDLSDRPGLLAAFRGADAVVSNAALVSVTHGDRDAFLQANLQGIENTLHAAAEAGVRRVLHTSSAVAYRPKPGHFYLESDPLREATDKSVRFSHYAVSKGAGERAAWTLAEALGLALTTVRPHTVFGAGDRGTFTIWLERLMALPITAWPTHVALPSIYAGDLAEAIARALERPGTAGRAYNLSSPPDTVTYWDLMRAYRAAGGGRARVVVPVPVPVRRRYDVSAAQRDLGFTPSAPAEAFRRMLGHRG